MKRRPTILSSFVPERVAVAVAPVLFAGLVASGIHGSSIGVWNEHVRDTIPSYSYPHVGTDRPIRSDEWCVSTPQALAQCANPDFFPCVNKRIAGGTDMFLATPCNPVWDWTVPGQFHNWGYFLFGAERGLSWNWWCRFLGIPLFAYLFLLGWLDRDRLLAATAALAVTFGAPTQWWDTTMPYLLLYFFSGLVFLRAIASREVCASGKALASIGLFVSLGSYAFVGYPPFAILLFPAFLILGWQPLHAAFQRNRGNDDCGATSHPLIVRPRFWLLTVLFLLTAEFLYFWSVHADTIRLIANSAYPGDRVFLGGSLSHFLRHAGLDIVSLFTSLPSFSSNLAPYTVPAAPNPCEAARYLVFGTALAMLFLFREEAGIALDVEDRMLAALSVVLLVWSAVPFPRWLAKCSGFFLFSPRRTEVIAGFILLLLTFSLFKKTRRQRLNAGDWKMPFFAASVSATFLLGALILPEGPRSFFVSAKGIAFLAAGILIVATGSAGLVSGSRPLFCGAYLLAALVGGLAVHPLARGTSPLVDKDLAVLVRSVDARSPGIWMANHWITGNFLLAQGLDCEPGTQTYAHRSFWSAIDPEGAKEREWNRYGNRIARLSKDGSVDIAATGDVIRFSVTERAIRDLGISHLVWSGEKLHEPWLRYEGRSRLHFVYTILPEAAGTSGEGQ